MPIHSGFIHTFADSSLESVSPSDWLLSGVFVSVVVVVLVPAGVVAVDVVVVLEAAPVVTVDVLVVTAVAVFVLGEQPANTTDAAIVSHDQAARFENCFDKSNLLKSKL